MTEGFESLLWGNLGLGNYPEESHPVICHPLDVGRITGPVRSFVSGGRIGDSV